MTTPGASTLSPSAEGTTPARPVHLRALDRFRDDWRSYVIYIGFALFFLLFAVLLHSKGFLTSTNLLNIVRQTATISVMAVAMTFVIACAEIDLSVGSVAGLSSVVTAMAVSHYGLIAGIAAGLGVGLLVGIINGGLVTLLNIPSFLVTLGMLGIAVGVAQWITSSAPQPILNNQFNTIFGTGDVGRVPGLLIWAVAAVALGAIVMAKTSYGRKVLATGGNRVAAQFTGIDTRRIKFTVMVVMSVVAALAGMLYAGRLQSGRFQWGTGDELSVIAAVILGGTSLFGGNGRVVGSLFGALLIGLINNALILAGLETSQQQVVRGVIIVISVALARRK
jgi:ribose transport system permease protein